MDAANTIQLDQTPGVTVLRPGGRHKPEIRVESLNGSLVAVKDFSPCGRWFRWLIGRWLVTRECRGYRAADGIRGIPRFVDRVAPYALALEYIDGRPCTTLRKDGLPADFWDQLDRIVANLHERGIAHGDLKKLANILVCEDGTVYLTDFSSAIISSASRFHGAIFRYVRDDDRRAITKAKLHLAPDDVTEQEHASLNDLPVVERLFRWFRGPIRSLIKGLGGRGED